MRKIKKEHNSDLIYNMVSALRRIKESNFFLCKKKKLNKEEE